MRKPFYFLIAIAIFLCSACGGKKENAPKQSLADSLAEQTDDNTVYGLACEGCTDSVVWILPLDAENVIDRNANPVKYDILEATRKHKVFGKIKTGDNIALVVNEGDSTVADLVIDIEQLKGTWCYIVMPTLRDADKMTKRQQADIIRQMPDSVKEAVFIPREYGFTLKRNNQASAVGLQQSASAEKEESPVVYEEAARYSSWRILGGRLVLTQRAMPMPEAKDSTSVGEEKADAPTKMSTVSDTADILFMREDSLVLQFADHQQSYYRLTTESEANKILREEAEKNARDRTRERLAEEPPAEEE